MESSAIKIRQMKEDFVSPISWAADHKSLLFTQKGATGFSTLHPIKKQKL